MFDTKQACIRALAVALIQVAAIGCLSDEIRPATPHPVKPTLLDNAKVASAQVTIHPQVSAIRAKNNLLVKNEVPRKLREAIMISLERGGHTDPKGQLTVSVEITNLLISQWTAGTISCQTRVLDAEGKVLKTFLSVSASSRGSDLFHILNDMNQRIVNGI